MNKKREIKNSRRALMSVPTYVKIGWKNNEAPPLNAANMNKMDEAIYLLTEAINSGAGGEVPAFFDVKNSDSTYDKTTFPTLLEIIDFIKTGIEGVSEKTRFIDANGEIISTYDPTSKKIASMKMIDDNKSLPEKLEKHIDYSIDDEITFFSDNKANPNLKSRFRIASNFILYAIDDVDVFAFTEASSTPRLDLFNNPIVNLQDGVNPQDAVTKKQLDEKPSKWNYDAEGNPITNLGDGILDTDGTNLKQVKDLIAKTPTGTPISVKEFNKVIEQKTIKTIPLTFPTTNIWKWNKTLLGDTTEFFNFNQGGKDYITDKIRLRFSNFSTTASGNINTTDTVIFEVSPSDFRLESEGFVDTIIGSFQVNDRTGTAYVLVANFNFGVSREIDTVSGSDKLYINQIDGRVNGSGYVLDKCDVEITTLKLAGSLAIKGEKGDKGDSFPVELDKHLDYSIAGEFSVFSKDKLTPLIGSYYHMDDEGITFGSKNDPILSITEVGGVKKIDAFGNAISNVADGVLETDAINFKQHKIVVNQVQKFNSDGEVINETYDPATTPKDPSSQKMIDDEVAPLKDKTQNLDEDGNVVSDVFDPDATPQAIATQLQIKENAKGSGLGSLETEYQNNLNLGQQNTQLDNLEIGDRILYRDYSDKRLAAEHIIIDNTQKDLSIPNLDTWVVEYDFVVAEDGTYNVKQLFFFKLLFTSPNKKFRIGSAVHNATTGAIRGEREEDYDFTKYTNDEIKEHIFNWFRNINVELETGYTYVFRMTLQGIDDSIGTFSPVVELSAGDSYELAEKSHFEISKLESKTKPPARENVEVQKWDSSTSAGGTDNSIRSLAGWTEDADKSNKDLFEFDGTTSRFHPKLYLVELANNSIDGVFIQVEFKTNGYISNRTNYYVNLETNFAGATSDNHLVRISQSTTQADYYGTHTEAGYTTNIFLPKTIQTTDSFRILKQTSDVSQADVIAPYHLTLTNLYLTGVKGDKGDAYNPVRKELFNLNKVVANGVKEVVSVVDTGVLSQYKNLQISIHISGLSLGEQNIVVLDWKDHSTYIATRTQTSEVVYAEHYTVFVVKDDLDQLQIINKTGASQTFTIKGSGELIPITRKAKAKGEK